MAMSRRRFLDQSVKGGFSAALWVSGGRTAAKAVAPSDKVVVGVMGVGGRGTQLTSFFAERSDDGTNTLSANSAAGCTIFLFAILPHPCRAMASK